MAFMYLSKENFTCSKPDINSLVNSVVPDQMASEEAS